MYISHWETKTGKPSWKETKDIILDFMQGMNDNRRYMFLAFGNDGQYTVRQKNYSFELVAKSGIKSNGKNPRDITPYIAALLQKISCRGQTLS